MSACNVLTVIPLVSYHHRVKRSAWRRRIPVW